MRPPLAETMPRAYRVSALSDFLLLSGLRASFATFASADRERADTNHLANRRCTRSQGPRSGATLGSSLECQFAAAAGPSKDR